MKVVRFFHIRPFNGAMKGGATVRVEGDTDIIGQVDMQVAFCSRQDQFVKLTGRIVASQAHVLIVPLRYLPRYLEDVARQLNKGNYEYDYDWAVKYFLPKE